MSRSLISIHKEIEKKAYRETPLGKVEAEIGKIYSDLKAKGARLPESVCKEIFDIRTGNEKDQLAYIERTNREHKEAVDEMLLKAMSKELKVIKKHLKL